MTEALARAVLVCVAKKLGGRWSAVDGAVCGSRAFGLREGEGSVRKRFRLEYGDDKYAMTFCHGDTWRQTLDDYVETCRWGGMEIPDGIKADSAEELVMKLAVSGEIRET